ncbi:DUF3592 domain-containing protein [Spirillospora sp. CA-142024]|uniref:DUF3592 domain-containing protein n=1 Tax=Spirillospora sp. CA-142024 TaxID=3240036 RepID=UPI003D8E40E6
MIEGWARWWDDWEREAALGLAGTLLVTGLALFGWGWYAAHHSAGDFRRHARQASAEVVSEGFAVRQRDRDGYPVPETIYLPTVRFTTSSGQQTTHQVACEANVHRQVGSRVNVLYDPDDPQHVCVAQDVRLSSTTNTITRWLGVSVAALGCLVGIAGLLRT